MGTMAALVHMFVCLLALLAITDAVHVWEPLVEPKVMTVPPPISRNRKPMVMVQILQSGIVNVRSSLFLPNGQILVFNSTGLLKFGEDPSLPVPLTGLADGPYHLELRTQRGNKRGPPINITFIIDNSQPTLVMDEMIPPAPRNGTLHTNSSTRVFKFHAVDTKYTPRINNGYTAGPGPCPDCKFECALAPFNPSFSPCSNPYVFKNNQLNTFVWTLHIRSIDRAGNRGAIVTQQWVTVVNINTLSFLVQPRNYSAFNTAYYTFEAYGNEANYLCQLDNNPKYECRSKHNGFVRESLVLKNLIHGWHTFSVTLQDYVGHVLHISDRFFVDIGHPKLSVQLASEVRDDGNTYVIGNGSYGEMDTVQFTLLLEPKNRVECQLNSDQWKPCSSLYNQTNVSIGVNTIRFRATSAYRFVTLPADQPVFTWTSVECPLPTPPANGNIDRRGTFNDGDVWYVSCQQGYVIIGDQRVSCSNGVTSPVQARCKSLVNECQSVSCGPNQHCKDSSASYECVCDTGYVFNGQKQCVDANECGTSPCTANANCHNTIGSYLCTCKQGFLQNGQQCIDIDECQYATSPCDSPATCLNTQGSYVCACQPGFTSSGRTCININECNGANTCHPNANCIDITLGYLCRCKTGFNGDGRQSCNDINECLLATSPCHKNETCQNTPGGYSCNPGAAGANTGAGPVAGIAVGAILAVSGVVLVATIAIRSFRKDGRISFPGSFPGKGTIGNARRKLGKLPNHFSRAQLAVNFSRTSTTKLAMSSIALDSAQFGSQVYLAAVEPPTSPGLYASTNEDCSGSLYETHSACVSPAPPTKKTGVAASANQADAEIYTNTAPELNAGPSPDCYGNAGLNTAGANMQGLPSPRSSIGSAVPSDLYGNADLNTAGANMQGLPSSRSSIGSAVPSDIYGNADLNTAGANMQGLPSSRSSIGSAVPSSARASIGALTPAISTGSAPFDDIYTFIATQRVEDDPTYSDTIYSNAGVEGDKAPQPVTCQQDTYENVDQAQGKMALPPLEAGLYDSAATAQSEKKEL